MSPDPNHPFTVAARRIACLASCGRGISVEEAEAYIRGECSGLEADKAVLTELEQGSRVILPKTKEHARVMLRAAFLALEEFEK